MSLLLIGCVKIAANGFGMARYNALYPNRWRQCFLFILTTFLVYLYWWTWYSTIGAKHAAVAFFRF